MEPNNNSGQQSRGSLMTGRILVVDDIATNRMILRAKLSAAYYDVILAESGAEALEKAVEMAPDLILLDVMMPDMDGFEVCRKLKEDPQTTNIPVVMVTALLEPAHRLIGLKNGADDFLSKPINDLALLSRVRNLLRAKFMFDELHLRNKTTQELGLGSLPSDRLKIEAMSGRIMLVPTHRKMSRHWKRQLSAQATFTLTTMLPDMDIVGLGLSDLPDVFVIHAKLGEYGDGLRLVSHLRSRPNTRHTSIILVVPDGDQETAAKGLDMGISDYIFDPFDPSEMIVRLNSLVRRKQVSDQLRDNVTDTLRLAVQDPLTGLYNRRYATQHLAKITERSRETSKGFALMLLDIDNFKRVNDTYGHSVGDQVLKEFSQRIQQNLRGVDLVSRIGGEEFLIAMPDTTKEQACIASERLRNVIKDEVFAASSLPNGIPVTVSIGVTLGDPGEKDVDALICQADKALYASKSDGRNMVTLFDSAA
jgi:two-component system, cell cycle response regulator